MKASELAELAAFDAVARLRSFRRAAGERGVTPSAISHAVTRLEARLGIRLLQRTTRNVSLTEAGARLLQQLSPAFTGIGLAVDTLNDFRETPFGTVRINAPNSIASFVLGPVLEPILRTNPQLQLEVLATDRLVDIVEEGFDAGIRLGPIDIHVESASGGMIHPWAALPRGDDGQAVRVNGAAMGGDPRPAAGQAWRSRPERPRQPGVRQWCAVGAAFRRPLV